MDLNSLRKHNFFFFVCKQFFFVLNDLYLIKFGLALSPNTTALRSPLIGQSDQEREGVSKIRKAKRVMLVIKFNVIIYRWKYIFRQRYKRRTPFLKCMCEIRRNKVLVIICYHKCLKMLNSVLYSTVRKWTKRAWNKSMETTVKPRQPSILMFMWHSLGRKCEFLWLEISIEWEKSMPLMVVIF